MWTERIIQQFKKKSAELECLECPLKFMLNNCSKSKNPETRPTDPNPRFFFVCFFCTFSVMKIQWCVQIPYSLTLEALIQLWKMYQYILKCLSKFLLKHHDVKAGSNNTFVMQKTLIENPVMYIRLSCTWNNEWRNTLLNCV